MRLATASPKQTCRSSASKSSSFDIEVLVLLIRVVCTLSFVYKQDGVEDSARIPSSPWDGQKGLLNAWNRFCYRFLGPAQNLPIPGEQPWKPDPHAPCPLCCKPLSSHVFDRGGPGAKTYMYCPKLAD